MPGNAGRKPLLVEVKKAKGTFRKHREKEYTHPSDRIPCAPSGLSKRGKQIFWHITNRLRELGRASASHTEIIATLARRMEEVEQCDKFLAENGFTYKSIGVNGAIMMKRYPESGIRSEALRHVHALLVELALTPVSASKVGVPKKEKKNNEFDGF